MSEFAIYCREKAEQCRRIMRMINEPVAIEDLKVIIAEFEAQAVADEAEELTAGRIEETSVTHWLFAPLPVA